MAKKVIIAPEAKTNRVTTFEEADQTESFLDAETPAHKRALHKLEEKNAAELSKTFTTVAAQVAETNFHFRSYKYQGADKLYPNYLDALQRFVTKCFPYAKDGMLLVDEPKTEIEVKKAFEKQAQLKKLGFRHLVVTPGMTYYEALEQLNS